MKESQLQLAVTKWLTYHRIMWWRMPLGAIIHNVGGKQIFRKNPLKGFPDIAGICQGKERGRFFSIELKSDSGRMTLEQKNWQNEIMTAGGFHAVVKSIEDLELVMVAWGEHSGKFLVGKNKHLPDLKNK